MKYKILLHWDDFATYVPIEGEVDTEGRTIQEVLEKIFYQEQECKGHKAPSVVELDIIELEDGRRFRILDKGFNELCSKPEHRYCNICSRFYLKREEVPKAIHMNVRNTFYKDSRNNLCDRCFGKYGIKERMRRNKGDINMEQFKDKIKELESEIKRLQEEKLSLQMLDMERQNAAILHEKFCTQNHIDECGWFHEIKDAVVNWEGLVHKNWVQKAERLIHAGYHVSDVAKIKDIMGSF